MPKHSINTPKGYARIRASIPVKESTSHGVRISYAEKAAINAKAKRHGLTASMLFRILALNATDDEIEDLIHRIAVKVDWDKCIQDSSNE